MKLNNEMCEMAFNNKGICTIYDENYVILKKSMPVTDDKLEWYIETIKKLKDNGVNISTIVDYKLLPETTKTFENVGSYTQGIFLEERAAGKSHSRESIYLGTKKDYDFNEIIKEYLQLVIEYVEELEKRAAASQEVFDKLVIDCKKINEVGLTIDPKPLNFFYDVNDGFTIIDVVPSNSHDVEGTYKYFPQYMFSIVFGYGKPDLSIEYNYFSVMPQELSERLNNAGKILEAKIVAALRKYGFSEDNIKEAVSKNMFRYQNKLPNVELEDMEDYIAQNFIRIKEENEKKKSEPDDFTFSW